MKSKKVQNKSPQNVPLFFWAEDNQSPKDSDMAFTFPWTAKNNSDRGLYQEKNCHQKELQRYGPGRVSWEEGQQVLLV